MKEDYVDNKTVETIRGRKDLTRSKRITMLSHALGIARKDAENRLKIKH